MEYEQIMSEKTVEREEYHIIYQDKSGKWYYRIPNHHYKTAEAAHKAAEEFIEFHRKHRIVEVVGLHIVKRTVHFEYGQRTVAEVIL